MSLGIVKEEPNWPNEPLGDLYKEHVVKPELVLGPVVVQPPDLAYNLNGQLLTNIKQEKESDSDQITITSMVCVKREPKYEMEDKSNVKIQGSKLEVNDSQKPKLEGDKNMAEQSSNMPSASSEPGEVSDTPAFRVDLNPMRHMDQAVKQELLKSEDEVGDINGMHQDLKEPASTNKNAPDSTETISEKLQSYVKLRKPKLSSRMRIQYESDTEETTTKRLNPRGRRHVSKPVAKTNKKFKAKEKPIYECDYCGKRCSYRAGIMNHIRIHTKEKPYTCAICSKKFSDCAVLIRHRRMHARLRPYGCDLCGKHYSEKYLLKNHKRVHTGEMQYFCTLCPKTFVNSSNFRRHQRVHMHKYKCDICQKNFEKKESLVSHIINHMKPKFYACRFCGKEFGQSGHFNRHLITHTGSKQNACTVCNKVFSQKGSLNRHVNRQVCRKQR